MICVSNEWDEARRCRIKRERDAVLEHNAALESDARCTLSALPNGASAPAAAGQQSLRSSAIPPEISDQKQVLFVGQVCWFFVCFYVVPLIPCVLKISTPPLLRMLQVAVIRKRHLHQDCNTCTI